MELPVLVALFGIATAVGLSNRSWIAGIAVLVLVPLGLFVLSWSVDAVGKAVTLAKAARALRDPGRRLEAVTRLRDAAYSLNDQRWAKKRATAMLLEVIEDADPQGRFVAACALARVDPAQDAPIAPLVEAIEHPGRRPDALDTLRSFGARAKPAVPSLIPLLDDLRDRKWWSVVFTLQSIGPEARAAVPALVASLERAASDEIEWPLRALGAIGDPAAVPALRRVAAEGKDERVRDAARKALQRVEGSPSG